ncbi:antitermination protein NusB [Arthrobacter sp. ZGTC412]|uniref:antitermination protein NusB n=1 Tax=Arthrobacter sp. ZGTC412 TaxID=2058900 RepID=UPI000CE54FF6|nr:antitermination protein NusB [Arthrobacter sp. ZGTC412]
MDSNYVNGGGMWFAIALINAGLAEQKNRSRLAWFFISMFFGPFATLLIVVLPAPLEAQKLKPRRSAASG